VGGRLAGHAAGPSSGERGHSAVMPPEPVPESPPSPPTLPPAWTSPTAMADISLANPWSPESIAANEDEVAAFYGRRRSQDYALSMRKDIGRHHADLWCLLKLLPHREPALPILDVACGSGDMLAWLADRGTAAPLHGRDLSEHMLEHARARLRSSPASLAHGSMLALGCPNATCAAVICTFALHHVDASGAHQTVHEVARVLARGGVAYFAVWEGEGVIEHRGSDLVGSLWPAEQIHKWLHCARLLIATEREEIDPQTNQNVIYIRAYKQSTDVHVAQKAAGPRSCGRVVRWT